VKRLVVSSALRRRPAPLAPPDGSEEPNLAPGSIDSRFLSGNGFASRCGHVLNYGPLRVNEHGRADWWFCKTDYVDWFFEHDAPSRDFVLFSHNSDLPVGAELRRHLRNPHLRTWYATNPLLSHPKLRALPIGIANARWSHGDTAALRRVQEARIPKSELYDASFSLMTNPEERRACVAATGLEPSPALPFEAYLERLASAYFCISPNGNGIDCHRTWEALYVRTIPVVTRSLVTDHHAELPLVVLDDWSQFRTIEFSADLYARLWGAWEPAELGLDRYLERVVPA
jgi:hypothetical protein